MLITIIAMGLVFTFCNKGAAIDPNARIIFFGLFMVAAAIGGLADRIGKEIKDAFSKIISTSDRGAK